VGNCDFHERLRNELALALQVPSTTGGRHAGALRLRFVPEPNGGLGGMLEAMVENGQRQGRGGNRKNQCRRSDEIDLPKLSELGITVEDADRETIQPDMFRGGGRAIDALLQ
jgi:hypothetical protein